MTEASSPLSPPPPRTQSFLSATAIAPTVEPILQIQPSDGKWLPSASRTEPTALVVYTGDVSTEVAMNLDNIANCGSFYYDLAVQPRTFCQNQEIQGILPSDHDP